MNRGHRLENLERSLGQASSASICFECADPARVYRMEFDLAGLFGGPEGRDASSEEAGAKLREMAGSADPDHCPHCGTLTTVGYVRERLK